VALRPRCLSTRPSLAEKPFRGRRSGPKNAVRPFLPEASYNESAEPFPVD